MDIQLETMGYGKTYLADMDLGKKIMDVLEKHYPLHAWFVDCNHEAGTATIQLMYQGRNEKLMIWKWGYMLHAHRLDEDDMLTLEKKVMRAGGEVLERYNMRRGALTENDLIDFHHGKIHTENHVR
jgi:hypothetical protein